MHIPSIVALALFFGTSVTLLIRARKRPLAVVEGIILAIAGILSGLAAAKLAAGTPMEWSALKFWTVAIGVAATYACIINEVRDMTTRDLNSSRRPMWRKIVAVLSFTLAFAAGLLHHDM